MRVLIKLKPKIETNFFFPYYLQVQGLIYHLIKNTKFSKIHSQKLYKFFCFSNIFPEKNSQSKIFRKNDLYNLIISSPNKDFLKTLAQNLIEKEEIKIEKAIFILKEIKFFDLSIKKRKKLKIVSVSPIIIRIPKKRYQEYKISSKISYPSLYWRPEYPLEAFLRQLEANIFKKYKEYHQKEIEEFPIFQKLIFKKSVSIPLNLHRQKVNFIGSLWEFHFDFLDEKTKEILEFAIDCGFGEKNSMGFGFVNLEKKVKMK